MHSQYELDLAYARERQRDLVAQNEHDRLVAACTRAASLSRRLAGPLGRMLLRSGARLMRYASPESALLPLHRPSPRSLKLN